MKIRELINEVGPSLVDLIRTTVVPTQGDQSKNQNATVRPKTGQTSIGPLTPSQASAQQQPGGGTQTSQDGVPPLGTTNQTATGQQPTVSNLLPALGYCSNSSIFSPDGKLHCLLLRRS